MPGTDHTHAGAPFANFASFYASSPYRRFVREQKQVERCGTVFTAVEQPRGTYQTPGTGDHVLGLVLDPDVLAAMDLGAGRFSFSAGQSPLFLSPAGVGSSIDVGQAHSALLMSIPSSRIRQLVGPDLAALLAQPAAVHAGGFLDAMIIQNMLALAAMDSRDDAANRALADGMVSAIVGALARKAIDGGGPSRAYRTGGLTPAKRRRAEEFMMEDLSSQVTLEQVAAAIGLSPFHFSRSFKISTGQSPSHWRIEARMRRAAALLQSTDLPIGDISAEVGFEAPQAFARSFRHWSGSSPSAYRRAWR